MLGPMRLITLGEMAAAVSNAGGFGQIAASGLPADRLQQEIENAAKLTVRPFGVNIPVHRENAFEALEIAIEYGIRTITTSGGNPARLIDKARNAGLRVLHKVSTTGMGLKAQSAGADGVIAMGFEAGGHGGRAQVTTFCLVPQLVDALQIPVIASGGIGDARGFIAALALGAEGVEIGTRFAATRECAAPAYFQEALLAARDTGTTVLGKDFMPLRVLRNRASESITNPDEAREEQATGFSYLAPDGNPETSIMPAGQVAGLIKEIKTASEIISELVEGAAEISEKLHSLMKESV